MTYDDASQACTEAGNGDSATLVSPANFEEAALLFAPALLSSCRLNAWSNQTCFRDGDGEKLNLTELMGGDFEVHREPAAALGMAVKVDLGVPKVEVVEGQTLATVCSYAHSDDGKRKVTV